MSNPFDQSKYSYGESQYFVCEVVNRDDPEQSGRCQVRVFGYQDGILVKEDLLWARMKGSTTNPQNGGIGQSLTGPMVGSYFYGQFMDGDGQNLLLDGSLGAAGKIDKESGKLDFSDRKHDTPVAARDDRKGGKDVAFDGEKGEYRDKPITEYAMHEAKNPHGVQTSKDGADDANQSWSLGGYPYGDYT